MQVTTLSTYPIKSTRGNDHDAISVGQNGLAYDRNWVVINEKNSAITGRQNQQMLAIETSIGHDSMSISYRDDSIDIPLNASANDSLDIQIFSSVGYGIEISEEVSQWISDKLGQSSRLVVFDHSKQRQVQEKHGGSEGETVAFADMNPILLISEASLEDLNSKLEHQVSMKNFRPNIVINGCGPFEEDEWNLVRIGSCEFKVVQQCERCVFTTIDPNTFEKSKTGEPLRTLFTYRQARSGKGVAFGMHLIPTKTGEIKLGDEIQVIS